MTSLVNSKSPRSEGSKLAGKHCRWNNGPAGRVMRAGSLNQRRPGWRSWSMERSGRRFDVAKKRQDPAKKEWLGFNCSSASPRLHNFKTMLKIQTINPFSKEHLNNYASIFVSMFFYSVETLNVTYRSIRKR